MAWGRQRSASATPPFSSTPDMGLRAQETCSLRLNSESSAPCTGTADRADTSGGRPQRKPATHVQQAAKVVVPIPLEGPSGGNFRGGVTDNESKGDAQIPRSTVSPASPDRLQRIEQRQAMQPGVRPGPPPNPFQM